MQDFGKLGITEAQIDMLDVAENFCRDKSPIDKVRTQIATDVGYDANIWAEIGSLGWLGISVPEHYGGVGLSMTEVAPVAEQLGRYMLATPFTVTTVAAQAILMGGTDAQKAEILPQLVSGHIATVALSEPHADWDLKNIKTQAVKTGSDYVLSGTKTFVAYAPQADWAIISTCLDGRPALFCVPGSDLSGASIRRETLIDETQRTFEIILDDLAVSADCLMDVDACEAALSRVHLVSNLMAAADMTGACQSCIDYTVEYLKTRKQFGKLIGSYQALKHPTVDAFVDYQIARSLLYAAAYSFDDQGTGEIATRMAKAQADKALSFAADRSIQFHGGFGFTYDCDAQLYRRRALFQSSQNGDARYHKKKLAELLL